MKESKREKIERKNGGSVPSLTYHLPRSGFDFWRSLRVYSPR